MLINIQDLTKSYYINGRNNIVLNNFDFALDDHEFVAIKGRSGCGKSTLLRIIGLMDKFDSGCFEFNGENIKNMSDRQLSRIRSREIGFVFQNFDLIPEYTILENLEMPLGYAGIRKKERRRRALEIMKRFELTDKLKYYPDQLSGGQQQRIAIARAVINSPKLILADEPTGNLDKENTGLVMNLFKELYDSGISIIVVTHDECTASFAERVMFLD